MNNQLDIILFGASGFTGTYCIESLFKLTKVYGHKFSWGIAGRSEISLKHALQESATNIGEDVAPIPVIVADVNDFESLKRMTARAKVLINCCGPFELYGEPIIKACIETGTHQVDVAAEVPYMERIVYQYHKAAEEREVYIVSACAFASIPADLGVLFLQDNFEGTVNSVEIYLELFDGGKGSGANYATYESLINVAANEAKMIKLRKQLYPVRLPQFLPKLKTRWPIHKSDVINKLCVPFNELDSLVIDRTQRYVFTSQKRRPVQTQVYVGLESFFLLFVAACLGLVAALLIKWKWGRNLLLNNPCIFTAGFVKKERPLKSAQSATKFSMTLQANGWNEKLSDVTHEFKTPPSKRMTARLSGYDPGYGLTANLVTLAAITILSEKDKLPKSGGVYTPGIAFQRTSLLKLAQENGLKFEIL